MKNLFSSFAKIAALAACALSLGSCGRAEYAMLPKGSSYHGVTRVATPVPATVAATTPVPAAGPVAAVSPAVVAEAQPTASAVAAAPTAKAPARVAATPAVAVEAPTAVAAAPASKLNLIQRMALSKVTRKMEKLMQKSGSVRQHDNTASTARGGISGNLRTGLIFLLVGLLISLFSGISGIFAIIGAIFAVIGLVFIILWLLDQA